MLQANDVPNSNILPDEKEESQWCHSSYPHDQQEIESSSDISCKEHMQTEARPTGDHSFMAANSVINKTVTHVFGKDCDKMSRLVRFCSTL